MNSKKTQARKVFEMLPSVIKHFSVTGRIFNEDMKQRFNFLQNLEQEGFLSWNFEYNAPDDRCPLSGDDVFLWEFVNEREVREYVISGLCKKTQDDIF